MDISVCLTNVNFDFQLNGIFALQKHICILQRREKNNHIVHRCLIIAKKKYHFFKLLIKLKKSTFFIGLIFY